MRERLQYPRAPKKQDAGQEVEVECREPRGMFCPRAFLGDIEDSECTARFIQSKSSLEGQLPLHQLYTWTSALHIDALRVGVKEITVEMT